MDALVADDLTLLGEKAPPQALKKIRDHHHKLAILVAQGKRTGEIAEMTGMSLSRISILKSDPAFQQLVAAYREKCQDIEFEAFRDVMAKRAAIEELVLELIEERLVEQEETLSIRDLHDLQADMADRLGRSKISKSVTMNVTSLADSLAVARQRRLMQLSASAAADAEAPGSVSSQPAEEPAPVAIGDK